MAAPTLIDYAESNWTDSSSNTDTTDDLNWDAAGDVIVVLGATEDNGLAMATPTGTGITLSALAGLPTNTGSSCKVYGWSATAAGGGNTALTSSNPGSSGARGIAAWSFSGVSALGTPGVNVGSGLTVSLTVAADSSVVMVLADWNATADVTVDTTPAGGTIRQNNQVSGLATFLVIQWDNQAAGTRSYGVTNWTGTGTVSKAAVEVQGVVSSSTTANAENALAGAAANNAAPILAVNAQAATATAGAADAGVAVVALAEVATASAAASDATVDAGTPTESLFTSQTPDNGNNVESGGISTATSLLFSASGTVTHIRFYATSTVGGTYVGELWQVTADDDPGPGAGTLLESGTLGGAATPSDWNTIALDSPVSVSTGVLYRAVLFSGDGRYVSSPSVFGAGTSITNGNLTAPADSTDPVLLGTMRQGTFAVTGSPGAYPSSTFGSSNYFIDVVFAVTTGGSIDAPAETAASTGAALDATVAVVALAEAATASASANNATALAAAQPAAATAAAAANDATVSASSNVVALAEVATATAEALFESGTSISLTLVADAPVDAAGTAYDAGVAVVVQAQVATAAGVANQPAVQTSGSATAPAEVAAGAATANDAAVAVVALAGVATASGAAHDATVSTVNATVASAECAEASATASDAQLSIVIPAGIAAAAGTAYDATTRSGRAVTPRPFTGTTARPFTGVTVRP